MKEDKERDVKVRECLPTIYSEKTVITVQPHSLQVGDLTSANLGSFIPLTGLQFLAGVERLDIQQTVELHDLLSKIESENRYLVKTPEGETLYVGAETSSDCQRLCCGSARGYQLTLVDPSRQTAATLVRRLACSCGCYLQRLDIYLPSWDSLGSVRQEWTFLVPRFSVHDQSGRKLFLIQGPRVCTCAMYKDATFQVIHTETGKQIGSIAHYWDQTLVNYNLSIVFPSQHLENKQKALLIGAAFLLEYLFFEQAKKTRCCSCF
ncbi:phospholipid scramblase 3-like isoform X2 [Macrosteles quadrilineatus]|uniref:phospholipid scramblase 3-like isoform X2 n=1 Tax=Macrosteles quadrilineatus TaxID=74068 RepID=UPI0023E11C11|nr:phospholipid scramblase 3-like isoform X2 [Macrosteles quadrilineatus]